MDNQDKTTFSLDDEEIVEEEVIDRDEEYDDDDYDDEEYDDEEYDDEEYDDEGYDDEEYDDGYNDDYYDDRLNKVLDEIAEIKRGMVPSTAVQQQMPPPMPMPPQYIYQPTAPPAGSEVVMYNEISRLRDELAKNQSSLEMQKELSRIKEDMARDQKIAEAQYNAEIQRLQSRIDDLLKNGYGPQGDAELEPARVEGGNGTLDMDKLLSINEAILRATRDSDSRLINEIGQLKKQLEDMPSLKELNNAVSSVKKATSGVESVPDAIGKLAGDIAALRCAVDSKPSGSSVGVSTVSGADITTSELLRQLYDIKTVIGNTSEQAVERTRVLAGLVSEYKKVSGEVLSPASMFKSKLTAAYTFGKKLSDCHEPEVADIVFAVNDLMSGLESQQLSRSVFADLVAFCSENGITAITTPMRDSAERYFSVCDKVQSANVDAYGEFLSELVAQLNILENNKKQQSNADTVSNLVSEISSEERDEQAIKELMSELTSICVGDVISLPRAETTVADRTDEEQPSVFAKLDELKAAVLDGVRATVEQAAAEAAPQQEQQETEATDQEQADDKYFEAVADILDAVDELKKQLGATLGATADTTDTADTAELSRAIEEVRSNYLDISSKLVEISENIQAVPEQEHGEPTSTMTEEEVQRTLDDLAFIRGKIQEHEQFITQISDLRNEIASMDTTVDISAPLAEQVDRLLNEIGTQFDKLYEDISNVLIESESNIINHLGSGDSSADAVELAKADILAETQVIKDSINVVSDMVLALPITDTLDAVRNEILAETQAIRDTLAVMSEGDVNVELGESLEQLRADVAAFMDAATANMDVAAADRQKVLDDVAFLREQAELALAESDQIPDGATAVQDTEKLVGYLDEIASRVTLIASIADDLAVTRDAVNEVAGNVSVVSENVNSVADNMAVVADSVNAAVESVNVVAENINAVTENIHTVADNINSVAENINAVTDNINSVADNIVALNDNVATITDSVAVISGSINPIADDVTAARDAATAVLDALSPITEQLNTILDRLDAPVESYDAVEQVGEDSEEVQDTAPAFMSDEELVELKDSLNTILDTLPLFPQADDVVAARDNTYSILDTLVNMPLSDDVVATRDNVAAILDAIGTLTDSIAALSAPVGDGAVAAEDVAALRETLDVTAEDVKFIREQLDNPRADEQGEDLANILQDIGLVLDKIEEYEHTSAENKQDIIDAVNGIREEIHINTLDENMSAAGMDGETRDAFIGEISDIRERLVNIESSAQAISEANAASLDAIVAQLTDLQAAIESDRGTAAAEGGVVADDNMQALIDELSEIKEKLDAQSAYDTVEEILSLREDIKAARIVDQDEVSGELESIKNELAAISSGNILDEIRALREDVMGLPAGEGTAPTDSEINLVLNEIVSLRDEVFAFKDEVLNATATAEPVEETEQSVESSDDINTILDELGELRTTQSAITDNLDELKDIISRRTTVSVADDESAVTSSTEGLNVVLDEIINLKNDISRIEESIGDDRIAVLSEQVDEIRAILDDFSPEKVNVSEDGEVPVSVDLTPVMEQFDTLNAAIDELRLGQGIATGEADTGAIAERFDALHNELDEIKATVAEISVPHDFAEELAELRAEMEALRAENEQLRRENENSVSVQLAELKELVRDMALSSTPQTADGDTSYAALIDEVRALREQMTVEQPQTATEYAPELAEIRDEIAQLRSLTTVSAEAGGAMEVAAIASELAELKELVAAQDGMMGIAEDVVAIREDVQALKNEPDLGVMSEILALRDEFQALREQIEEVKNIAGKTDREADESLMNEVQSLRDQLFAISMANVNDPSSGETGYESYNNIILDELASIRDQVNSASTSTDMDAISEEFAQLKATLDKHEEQYDALAERVAKLSSDTAKAKILDELSALRTDVANQRKDNAEVRGVMTEMANLVERQNKYLESNANADISSELQSLKAELASSDAVAEEVAKLREVMIQSGSSADNDTILNELAELREELSKEKPTGQNALILDAIARLRDEVTVLAEREKVRDMNSDATLSDSISDLKEQLNEIAGIVEPAATETKPTPVATPAKTPKKRGKKTGQSTSAKSKSKSTGSGSTGKKRGRPAGQSNKAAAPVPPAVEPATTALDFNARIDEQVGKLGGESEMSLNIHADTTTDAMDVADKLAKQVANKLIMEQLVEQLGDGGVSEDRVDEILRDILPQEFTTIAETEASDKVRRLANQLVLNKLRSRLNGRSSDED